MNTTRCTITTGPDSKCGRPAVVTFRGILSGETFGECEDHAVNYRRPLSPVRIERYDVRLGWHLDRTPRTKRQYRAVDAHTGEVVASGSYRNVIERQMQAAGRRIVR